MTHRASNKLSHTFDIKKVISVDLDRLTITYIDAAHASSQSVTLRADRVTPAAQQMVQAMAESISVHGDGMWESAIALGNGAWGLSRSLVEMERLGITDFAGEVTIAQLNEIVEPFAAPYKRTLNKLFARILRAHNPNGQALAIALTNTSYTDKAPQVKLYDDCEFDAIRTAAGGVFNDAFKAQRELLKELGYDTAGRAWLRISAAEILVGANERNGHLKGARQPLLNTARTEQIDWALLNPELFGVSHGPPKDVGNTQRLIGRALYPPLDVLVAAIILHCLTEHNGLNLSVMLRTAASDLIYTGETNGMLDLAKARNHSQDTIPVRTGSNKTLGGLIESLTAITRFARHWRATQLISGDVVPEVVNRLYVRHKRDPTKSEVLSSDRLHDGWRCSSFDEHWDHSALNRMATGLRFGALRRKVLEQAVATNPSADVHGHSKQTRVDYCENVIPEDVLARHVSAAQDSIIDAARSRYGAVAPQSTAVAAPLVDALRAGTTADLIASVCISAGNDPDEEAKPCSLGLAACFTCRCGYRTADHIPGLHALVRYTEIIRDNDADEWENGEAALLHVFGTKTLSKFPSSAVEAARKSTAIEGHMISIHHLYTEPRR
jgi:hypothetical protein